MEKWAGGVLFGLEVSFQKAIHKINFREKFI